MFSATVLFCVMTAVVFSQPCIAAQREQANYSSHYHLLANVTCEQCHGKAHVLEVPTMEKCLACHGSTTKLAEKTKGVKPRNPHTSPHYGTELDCNFCHHQHTKSENYCLQCHSFGFKTP